jgi:hypothetical protein
MADATDSAVTFLMLCEHCKCCPPLLLLLLLLVMSLYAYVVTMR